MYVTKSIFVHFGLLFLSPCVGKWWEGCRGRRLLHAHLFPLFSLPCFRHSMALTSTFTHFSPSAYFKRDQPSLCLVPCWFWLPGSTRWEWEAKWRGRKGDFKKQAAAIHAFPLPLLILPLSLPHSFSIQHLLFIYFRTLLRWKKEKAVGKNRHATDRQKTEREAEEDAAFQELPAGRQAPYPTFAPSLSLPSSSLEGKWREIYGEGRRTRPLPGEGQKNRLDTCEQPFFGTPSLPLYGLALLSPKSMKRKFTLHCNIAHLSIFLVN